MAHEKIRNWKPEPEICIKYWIDKKEGKFAYWQVLTKDLYQWIKEVIREHSELDIKLTNRQLYYQLVGQDLIPNYLEVYKRICAFLTDCRYAGLIDWEHIEDRDRVPEIHADWENVSELIDSAVASYRLPRWKGQDYYVEMYCEKKAGISVLKPLADKYHIYFGYNKGYSSASAMYDLYRRCVKKLLDGRMVVILYFGDHDPSGVDMIRDIRERIQEFLINGDYDIGTYGPLGDVFLVDSVALNKEQIKRFNLPPNPAKLNDSRSKKYIQEHGEDSWELDAIKPMELRKIAKEAILKYLDIDLYNEQIEKENKDKKNLKEFALDYTSKEEGEDDS